MQHAHLMALLQLVQQGRRARRAPDHRALQSREFELVGIDVRQHTLPHGRHARRDGDALGLEQLVQRAPVQPRSGKHQLGPDHWSRVWKSPGVTWNIGTTGSTVSRDDRLNASGSAHASE